MNAFNSGIKKMLPLIPGVIPFGLVMGTAASQASLNLPQAAGLNVAVYAGASQLAALNLMTQDTSSLVIVITGMIINIRFILYSAAFAPILENSSFMVKSLGAYFLTDQSYAVSMANDHIYKTNREKIHFFFGNSFCMAIFWHLAVFCGFQFGNLLPSSIPLDFAVPLSFMALTIPTLKSKNHIYVAISSFILSIAFFKLPYGLGLALTGAICISFAVFLLKRSEKENE